MRINEKEYQTSVNILDTIRGLNSKSLIKEDNETPNSGTIAITDDPKFGSSVLTLQKETFLKEVDNSARFDSNPLVLMKSDGNLVFSGTIPSLNNLKFQYSMNDSDGIGVFVWVEGLRMNEDNMITMKKLYGHYLNWRDEWRKESGFLDKLRNDE